MPVFVATPTTRDFNPLFVASLIFSYKPEGMIWDWIENQPVALARNIMVERFLKEPSKPRYLCLIDSDATWHPEAIIRLMERDVPVVTDGIYKRSLPPVPTIGHYVGLNQDGHHTYNFGSTIKAILDYTERRGIGLDTPNELCLPPSDDDLIERDGFGTHFCMIRRDVLDAIEPPWFQATDTNSGEDFYFCRRVQAAGFKLYLDLSVHTGHIVGPGITFGLREFLGFYRYTADLKDTEELWDVGMATV